MTLSSSVKDNEQSKFRDAGVNGTKVAVTYEGTTPVPVEGSFAPSGLRIRLKVTNTTVTDVAQALPLIPLENRNSIIIENRGLDSIFVGESDVTSSGSFQGWEIAGSSIFSTDITETILLYTVAPSGKTVDVKIMELA